MSVKARKCYQYLSSHPYTAESWNERGGGSVGVSWCWEEGLKVEAVEGSREDSKTGLESAQVGFI